MKYKITYTIKGKLLNQFKKTLMFASFFTILFFSLNDELVYAASTTSETIYIRNQAESNYVELDSTQTKKQPSNIVTATVTPTAPPIKVEKTVSDPVEVAGQRNTFDMVYTIKASNISNVPATYVHLTDNLDCTYRMYGASRPVKSWSLTQQPRIIDGPLVASSAYTGSASCSSDKVTAFDPRIEVQLVDGKVTLAPHTSSTVTYGVRITLASGLPRTQRTFINTVFAVILKSADSSSAISAAASAATPVVPIDPSGVVYNAVTRQPVSGAITTLTRTSCLGVSGPITPAQIFNPSGILYTFNADGSVTMTTGADGAYSYFFNIADDCQYQLTVQPPANSGLSFPSKLIPVTAGIAPAGQVQPQPTPPIIGQDTTYYLNFLLSAGADVFNNHVPLDPKSNTGSGQLFLEKKGNKTVFELGDTLLYTLSIKNFSGDVLDTAQVKDILPRGFRLIAGSSRLENKPIPDPVGAPGALLQYNLSNLQWANEQTLTLTYLVQAGAGVSLDSSSINHAQVFSNHLSSNESGWPVTVTGGVFSDEAYLIGKVYLEDCHDDKVQQGEEMGIPGVRLFLEDGTSVVTDIDGKYSLYGLSPITHVLKLDGTTLPAGSRLIPLSNRNSGKGDSRFVDLKNGELHKADFAVSRCDAESVVKEVYQRYKALQDRPVSEGEALIKQKMNPSYTENNVTDPRSLPATGILTPTGIQALGTASNTNNTSLGSSATNNSATTPANLTTSSVSPVDASNTAIDVFHTIAPNSSASQENLQESLPSRLAVMPLEEVIKSLDNKTGFIELKDGDTLPIDTLNVRVKGLLGANLQLSVNGEVQSTRRVGKKSKLADKNLEAWEYIGVSLKPGANKLLLEVTDTFGNVRESQAITVIAPGKLGRIEINAPSSSPADAKTAVKIKVRLVDDNGVPVTARTQLTLETDQGRWDTKDLNPNEPGTQVFIESGVAEFTLIPPSAPKEGMVRVSSGILHQGVTIAFLPELRPLIGAGIIEGQIDLSKAGKVNIMAPSSFDAFERELHNISVSGNNLRATGRAAFFFKGTIKGEYLLTAAYDSDKKTNQRLFRDIQPAKFYPIYGDSSMKSFDAQSTQRLYVRVDKDKSYLLYGDFTTSENNTARKLSQYNRSVTGIKSHYENGDFSANAFVNRDALSQVITEIPANGTSGPYKLSGSGSLYENSEKVEILVRDRNQPSVILETIQMSRFSDYVVDPLSREIFFKGPVASIDTNLNPRTIRVTYEVKSGGKDFWMGGADARLKVTDYLELGASYERDGNPQKKYELMGATAMVKLGDKTTLIGEVARSNTGVDSTGLAGANSVFNYTPNPTGTGEGLAERIELRHDSEDLKVNAQVTHASKNFNNPTGGFSSGRTEATANISYKIDDDTNLKGQAIYSKDNLNGGVRAGALASISYAFNEILKGELGLRGAHETTAPAQPTSGATPNDLLAIRARLTAKLPWIEGADVYGEAEQDVLHSDRHILAAGASYLLNDKTRLYGRYQFISSLSNSSYSVNGTQQNNTAVIGIESAYMTDGRLFSEYRIRDAINGRESQAAMGLRQTWTVADGLKVGGSFEMTHAFAGQAGSDSKAITALAEYVADPRYKLTGSLEARFASTGNSYLNTLGLTYKINEDWSALARNSISLQQTHADHSQLLRSRQQIGVAWRQVAVNQWNALARYEHLSEIQKGGVSPYSNDSHIFSTHVNYQPHRNVITSGRYAFKWSKQTQNDITSNFMGHLLYGRVTWDFWPEWDISVQAGMLADRLALQYAQGVELGYQAMNDLWVSAGYNVKGFDGGGLQGTDYTSRGFYVRMRYKFDEGLFN